MKLSVIVSTYNAPRYLSLVLDGLICQFDEEFECIVADDGSAPETREIVEKYSTELRLIHSWQADRGFRLAASRNRALGIASGEVIAFLDGDCIPSPYYVEDAKIILNDRKVYAQGHRVILGEEISKVPIAAHEIFSTKWLLENRSHLSNLKNGIRHPFPRISHRRENGVRGCNMIFRARDLHELNGFDEEFEGWGHEDKDIVRRFFAAGGKRLDARGRAQVYHLYHPEHSREQDSTNLSRAREARPPRARQGLR